MCRVPLARLLRQAPEVELPTPVLGDGRLGCRDRRVRGQAMPHLRRHPGRRSLGHRLLRPERGGRAVAREPRADEAARPNLGLLPRSRPPVPTAWSPTKPSAGRSSARTWPSRRGPVRAREDAGAADLRLHAGEYGSAERRRGRQAITRCPRPPPTANTHASPASRQCKHVPSMFWRGVPPATARKSADDQYQSLMDNWW